MNVNTKEFWNDVFQREEEYYAEKSWRTYPTTFNFIADNLKNGKKIIELGCGMGILAEKLIKQGNTYYGIDISAVPKKRIESLGGVFFQADIMNLRIDSKNMFDYLIATEFLEHFEDADFIVKHSKQFLKKTGTAIFSVPNNFLGHEDLEEHYQQFTRESLGKLFLKYYENVVIYDYVEFYMVKNGNKTTGEIIRLPTLLVYASD